jgi:hypothetical protein
MMAAPVVAMAVPVTLVVIAALGAEFVALARLRRGALGADGRVRATCGARGGRRDDGKKADGRGNESKMSHLFLLTRCLPSQKT